MTFVSNETDFFRRRIQKSPLVHSVNFFYNENRFSAIKANEPEMAEVFLHEAESEMKDKWKRLMIEEFAV